MALAPTHEDMVRKWQHSHSISRFTTPVIIVQDPGYDLFYTLVFGFYYNPNMDPHENYVESRQFSIYDKLIFMEMEYTPPTSPIFKFSMRHNEAVTFVYHVSDRESFLELPSVSKKACNAIMPQPVIPQPGRGAFGAGFARWILRRLHLRHTEAQPPPPFIVLAVSDMDPKSTRTRQVTSEEGESFSRSIGAIFLELSCSRYSGIDSPEVRDDAMRELSKRVILKRAYVEKLAKEGKVVNLA